jgi:hypothetical protein
VRQLAVLVSAVLALAACGGGAGGAGSPQPVSGSTSPAGAPAAAVGRVEGVVVDGAGRPVPGALVVPRAADAQTPGVPEIAVHTDARGRFTWSLRPGSYELVAQLGERRTAPVAVMVKPGSSPRTVELSMPD